VTNTEKFNATYPACFTEAFPGMPEDRRKILVEKSLAIFPEAPRRVILDSPALKLTAKRLGIENTYKAWEEFFLPAGA
jgi:hypothetical protein